jgi:gamma-glutamylcyclotransferase (GGCT)/AIG2-like uncharacterized protein YtfP
MSVLVFAYGSNMCSARLLDYSVTPESVGEAAVLHDHRLLFNKWSQKHLSGKANVEPSAGAHVWGVLYSIPDAQLPVLDRGEGSGYQRSLLTVATLDGSTRDAWVYRAKPRSTRAGARPFSWYRDFLLLGAKEHGLPPDYQLALAAIEAESDPDATREAGRRELM